MNEKRYSQTTSLEEKEGGRGLRTVLELAITLHVVKRYGGDPLVKHPNTGRTTTIR